MVVSVTSCNTNSKDTSCILETGDHSFIKHKSYIDYSRSRIMTFSEIFNGINKNILIKKEDVSDTVLKKIQNGAKNSDFLPTKFYHFFNYF